MSRRWIQSACIVLVFLVAFGAVVFLGMEEGQRDSSLQSEGFWLSEKVSWNEAIAAVPETSADPTVYVTKSGSKYHLTPDCSGLSRAKEIIGTPQSAAEAEGKNLCSICAEE